MKTCLAYKLYNLSPFASLAAMAFSLGSSRRWPCRAARRGGKERAGCRHFHVHYHFPRQVCAFSSLRLPPPFSLLTFLLILPVLFLAVLAFFVCFGWFTLVYFVSSVLRKCNSPECLASDRDDDEVCRNEEQARKKEGRAENSVVEVTGGSAMAEVCIEGQPIKEVFVDEFFNAYLDMSSTMASPYDCSRDEERSSCEELVEEEMVFEIDCKDFNEIPYLHVSSEKGQTEDPPVNWCVEKIGSRELCTSCGTSNLVHLQADQEIVANRKEDLAYANAEIPEFVDKHETGAVIEICPDDSGENYVKCREDLPDDFFAMKLPEDIVEEQQDAQNTSTDRTTKKLREDHFIEEKAKQGFGNLEETHDPNNETEMSGLSLDSVSENKYSTVSSSNAFHLTNSEEKDGLKKELKEDNRAQASGTTSLDCDFGENNQDVIEDIGVTSTEDNIILEVASGESSVIGWVEDENENSSMSEGGRRRLPLIRRSQPPWWNLCGVLDVFAGCQD